jgi:hypothetical protein
VSYALSSSDVTDVWTVVRSPCRPIRTIHTGLGVQLIFLRFPSLAIDLREIAYIQLYKSFDGIVSYRHVKTDLSWRQQRRRELRRTEMDRSGRLFEK